MNNVLKVCLMSAIAFPMFTGIDAEARTSGVFIELSGNFSRTKGSFTKNSDLLGKYERLQNLLKSDKIQKKLKGEIDNIRKTQDALLADGDGGAAKALAVQEIWTVDYNACDTGGDDQGAQRVTFMKCRVGAFSGIGRSSDKVLHLNNEGEAIERDDTDTDVVDYIPDGFVTEGTDDYVVEDDERLYFVPVVINPRAPYNVGGERCENGHEVTVYKKANPDQGALSRYVCDQGETKVAQGCFVLTPLEAAKVHTENASTVLSNLESRKLMYIRLDEDELKKTGYDTIANLLWLNPSGNGIHDNGSDLLLTQVNQKYVVAEEDFDLQKAFDEKINADTDTFQKNVISYGKANKLTAEDGSADLKYSDVKKVSFGGKISIGYKKAFGDFSVFGGLLVEKAFTGKTLEIGSGVSEEVNKDSSTTSDDKDSQSSTLNYNIDVKKKTNFGVTVGLSYRLTKLLEIGAGVDVVNRRYEINTNDIGKLFIAEKDVVTTILDKLGENTYDFNKDVLKTGLLNKTRKTSTLGVEPFFRLSFHLNSCASLFAKVSFSTKSILKNSEDSIGNLKLTGFAGELGLSLTI